jgi:perosamine synthetase
LKDDSLNLMKQIPFGLPIIGEEERVAVLKALDSPQLVHGPISTKFEKVFSDFLGPNAHSSAVASATAGLYLAYLSLGIGHGDEVIVTSLTHVATANAIIACGAEPIFVDVDIRSGNIDHSKIENLISERTKAISVVHFLGNPVDMNIILQIANKFELRVIEDCALALGSRIGGRHVGLFGDFGVFSFYPAKHITTGEGGMIVSNDMELIKIAEKMKSFNYDKGMKDREIPGVYDIEGFGMNLRLSEIAAALGVAQMNRLANFLNKRKINYERYLKNQDYLNQFGSFITKQIEGAEHSHYCSSFLLNNEYSKHRNSIIKRMKTNGVSASVYYPVVIPYSKFYKSRSTQQNFKVGNEFPNAQEISSNSIALPVGPHLELIDVDTVCEALKSAALSAELL